MSTTVSVRNGIDVARLLETVEAIQGDANLADFMFRARSSWRTGTHNVGEIGGFAPPRPEGHSPAAPLPLAGARPPPPAGPGAATAGAQRPEADAPRRPRRAEARGRPCAGRG